MTVLIRFLMWTLKLLALVFKNHIIFLSQTIHLKNIMTNIIISNYLNKYLN